MSFLSDLLEGNFGNLGTDILHAPESLARHPDQIAELAGAIALPFAAPEILGALGVGDVLGGLGGDLAGSAAAGLGETVGAEAVPAGVEAASLAGLGDVVGTAGEQALAFAPTAADFAGTAPAIGELGTAGAAGTTAGLPALAGPATASIAAPSEILAGDPAISAALDTAAPDLGTAAIDTAPTTSEFATAANPAVASDATGAAPAVNTGAVDTFAGQPPAELAAGSAPGPNAIASGAADVPGAVPGNVSETVASAEAPAIGQVAAEGGPSSSAIVDAAQAGGAAAAAPESFLSSIGGGLKTLGGIASNPLAQLAVPGGFLAYNLLKGPPGIPPQAQQALANAQSNLGPLQGKATQNTDLFNTTAATDLNLANNFQVSPAQAAQLEIYKQDQYNQLRQQIANQNPGGQIENSSQWIQGKAQIDQQVIAQQTQMINQLIQTAFQASTAANAGLSTSANITAQYDNLFMQAANLQVQQDQAFNTALAGALQSFGLIAGLQGGNIAKSRAA